MPTPSLLAHLTLIAERIAPAITRMPKSQRGALARGTWDALDSALRAAFDALNDPTLRTHRKKRMLNSVMLRTASAVWKPLWQ